MKTCRSSGRAACFARWNQTAGRLDRDRTGRLTFPDAFAVVRGYSTGEDMRSIAVSVALIAALATPVYVGPAVAQNLMDKATRDDITLVPRNDPDMAAAMRKARAALPEFFALVRKPNAFTTGFAVKVAVRDKNEVEYFWVTPFTEQDGRFTGRINNTPRLVTTVKFGQPFTFSEGEIVDWLYLDAGRMKGNYTACALLKREPSQAADFKKKFGLDCEP